MARDASTSEKCGCHGCRQDAVPGLGFCPYCDDGPAHVHCEHCDNIVTLFGQPCCEMCGAPLSLWASTALARKVETYSPQHTPRPIGPYSHIAKVGQFITIGGTAAIDPKTGRLAGADVDAQTKCILTSFEVMLRSAGSGLDHIIHVNVFLKNMSDFAAMNRAYVEMMGNHRPARTVVGVNELPIAAALLTMNLTAVTK